MDRSWNSKTALNNYQFDINNVLTIQMGNHNDSAPTLAFLDRIHDQRFGEVDIYRTEDGRFVMKLRRTHVIGQARHCLFKRVNEWLQEKTQQYVVPIMLISSHVEKGLCIQVEESETFTQYYNFTLLDLVRTKKELELPEMWLICQALLTLTTNLRKHKLAINLKADNVFITLKGLPCVYSHHFLSFEESIVYSDYSMGQQVALVLLQLAIAEEVRLSDYESHNHLLPLIAKVCTRNKMLGAFVKQLLNREKNEEEVLQEIDALLQTGEISKSAEIKLNKFRYALPEQSAEKAPIEKEASLKKNYSNAPIEFKPRKASKTEIVRESKPASSDCKPRETVTEQPLKEIGPNKQVTEQLFCQLARKKQEAREKMAKVLQRKEELLGKENKLVRKSLQGCKHR